MLDNLPLFIVRYNATTEQFNYFNKNLLRALTTTDISKHRINALLFKETAIKIYRKDEAASTH